MKLPSTLTVFLAAATVSITPAFADLLIYEPFNYSPGSTIIGQTDLVTSATATWFGAGTAGTGVRHQVIAGSLSGLPFAQGNSADTKNADNTELARMNLPSQYNPATKPGYTLFYSLLLNVPSTSGMTVPHSNVNANNDVITAFNNSAGPQAGRPSVWAGELVLRLGNDTNQYNMGIRASTTVAGTTFFTGDLATNQTHFVVVEYVAGTTAGTGGQNYLWIDPDPSTFGAATAPTATGETDGTLSAGASNDHADSLLLGAGIAAGATPNDTYVDEIRVGTNWANVTATNIPVTISSQPRNTRGIIGSQATFSVSTVFANTFQWYKNGSPIPTGTQSTLTLSNIQSSDAGTYNVVVGNGTPTLASSNATLTVFPDIYPRLAPLWTLAPGSRPYLTTDGGNAPNERCIAYNSLSNTVLLVSRTNSVSSATNPAIYVLNADTAADLYQMNVDSGVVTGGLNNNSLSLNYIDVADDGAVIAGNVGDNSSANFNLYYWTDSASATEPVRVWTGDPSGQGGQRFGDYFAVRGAGANTQVLLDNQLGTFGALLMPNMGNNITDPDSWTGNGNGGYGYFANPAGGTTGGRTLLFSGTDAAFWEKHGSGNFNLVSYDIVGHTGTIVTNYPNVSGSPTQIALNAGTNVMVGIVFSSSSNAPDTLVQYDITDPTQPLFIKSYNFPTNHQDNANGCGRVIFKGDRVYALDSNNGMVAWTLVPVLHIGPGPSGLVLSWSGETPGYTLTASPSLATPTTWTNVSTGTLIGSQYFVTNAANAAALFYRLQK
jgi:hypothetical protein